MPNYLYFTEAFGAFIKYPFGGFTVLYGDLYERLQFHNCHYKNVKFLFRGYLIIELDITFVLLEILNEKIILLNWLSP